jgi:hypothetical protein
VEEVEKVQVEIPLNTFRTLAKEHGANNIENFLRSQYFTKEFKTDGHVIRTTREL